MPPSEKPWRRCAIICAVLAAFVFLWLIPWVFALHLGMLVYFPYRPDGKARYVRATGPLPALFGAEWAPRSEIPKAMLASVVAAEDANFYEHSGVDWESLRRSYRVNERLGRYKRGGSTVTQQLVKNGFLSREKSYVRKARELVGALLLDLTMAKESQLVWYLNVVEFGPNLYGIESAARHYFRKEAARLTPVECIELAVILPRPNRWNRSLITKQYTPFFQNRYRVIYNRLRALDLLDERDMRLAREKAPFPIDPTPVATRSELPPFEEPPRDEDSEAPVGEAASSAPTVDIPDSTVGSPAEIGPQEQAAPEGATGEL